MTELARVQRRLIPFQSHKFNFERGSTALLASFKRCHQPETTLPMDSEWRDPPRFRIDTNCRQGVHHG